MTYFIRDDPQFEVSPNPGPPIVEVTFPKGWPMWLLRILGKEPTFSRAWPVLRMLGWKRHPEDHRGTPPQA